MATKYERKLVKLEDAAISSLHKVHVDYDPAETERVRQQFMQATKGRGSFVVIPAFAADL